MADVLTNMTQVITQSPQVSSLVGGQLAATEDARLQAQLAESERQRRVLEKTVLALEDSSTVAESDPDARRRLETSREQRRRRYAARQAARLNIQKNAALEQDDSAAEKNSFEPKPVIDVCV